MEELDWATEWYTSLLWVGKVFGFTVIGFALAVWLLTRHTGWGRQFRRLAAPYFRPGEDAASWRPLLMVGLLLLLSVVAVRTFVLLSYSTNGIYTALQQTDPGAFAKYLGIFGVLATIHVIRSLFTFYVEQMFTIHWRTWMNSHLVGDWLDGHAYHRMRFLRAPVDNPDQRIQEDITSFATTSRSLGIGATESVVSMVSFTVVLWQLSGPLTILGTEVPRAMTFLTYIYVIIATVFAFRIGRPLIRLNFINERLTASYRYSLIRVRDNSETVAFYRGEPAERSTLIGRFAAVISNVWDIVFRSLKFQGFNLTVSQLAVVFPLIIQAPRFFSGAITLGDVTQTATAFDRLHDSLSFFRLAYDDFAGYRAVLDRLTGLLDATAETRALPAVGVQPRPEGLEVRDLTVRTPDGQTLIDDLALDLAAGDTLLVRGRSGSGKTTLLRTLADLWPHVEGSVSRPVEAHALFLSQQPYVPLGSLRAALAYPELAGTLDEDRAREVLRQVQLAHLSDVLDEEYPWAQTLSPGEQQRLGFGRLLLSRPRIAFLDEATAALDEGIEHALYTLVRAELPECVVVSVGHRATLEQFHGNYLELLGDGRWSLSLPAR